MKISRPEEQELEGERQAVDVREGARLALKDIEYAIQVSCLQKCEAPLRKVFDPDERGEAVKSLAAVLSERHQTRVRILRKPAMAEAERSSFEEERDALKKCQKALPVILNGGDLPPEIQLLVRKVQGAVAAKILELQEGRRRSEALEPDEREVLFEKSVDRCTLLCKSPSDIKSLFPAIGFVKQEAINACSQVATRVADLVQKSALVSFGYEIDHRKALNMTPEGMHGFRLPSESQIQQLIQDEEHGQLWLRNLTAWIWNMLNAMPDRMKGEIAAWSSSYIKHSIRKPAEFKSACERVAIRLPEPKNIGSAYTTRSGDRNGRLMIDRGRIGHSAGEKETFYSGLHMLVLCRNELLGRLAPADLHEMLAHYCAQEEVWLHEAIYLLVNRK